MLWGRVCGNFDRLYTAPAKSFPQNEIDETTGETTAMKMASIPLHLYERAVALCDEVILKARSLPSLEGLEAETLQSIYRQRYQVFIKRTAHLHRHPEALAEILDAYYRGEKIADIAGKPEVNFSPYLLARIVIENILDIPKGKVGEVVKSPTTLIPEEHARLRDELRECIEVDQHCSPAIDKLRAAIGDSHEDLLMRQLTERRIPFADEEELR